MKKTCLIHQQQGIGDLIFIQKIIQKYVENDFNVICPILIQHRAVRDHFSSDRVRYPLISEQSTLLEGFEFALEHIYLVSQCESHFGDSLFTKPIDTGDFVFLALGPAYKRLPGGMMQSKYGLAGMDFSNWQDHVKMKRNHVAENALFDHLGLKRNQKYTLINEFSSNGRIEIRDPGDAVYMRNIPDYTLLDWLAVLERCSRLITVDTSLVLLAEVFLKKTIPMYLLSKWPTGEPSYDAFKSALRLPWKFTPHVSDMSLE